VPRERGLRRRRRAGLRRDHDDQLDQWSVDQIGGSPKPNLGAIGCPSTTRCVAVGGTVFAGSGL
jgi:hypothetical protein